jgi:ankyrin repeat protein
MIRNELEKSELSDILQLLKRGANPNIPDPNGVYPLFRALRYGNNTSCDQKIRDLGYGLVMALLDHEL